MHYDPIYLPIYHGRYQQQQRIVNSQMNLGHLGSSEINLLFVSASRKRSNPTFLIVARQQPKIINVTVVVSNIYSPGAR